MLRQPTTLAPTVYHTAIAASGFQRCLQAQVYSLANQNRFYKKAAAFCLRSVARHSPELAQAVVDCGALDSMVTCLEEFDPGVKEGAAWALGYIASHNRDLAQQVVDAGAVPLLVLCVQEPELMLKRIAASALSDIAKHSPELAQAVVDAGAVAYLGPLVTNQDAKLKRQVRLLPCLIQYMIRWFCARYLPALEHTMLESI